MSAKKLSGKCRKRQHGSRQIATNKTKNTNFDFEVDKIYAKRTTANGTIEYLIKWTGYSDEHNSWEPMRNLNNCLKIVNDFNSKQFQSTIERFDPVEGIAKIEATTNDADENVPASSAEIAENAEQSTHSANETLRELPNSADVTLDAISNNTATIAGIIVTETSSCSIDTSSRRDKQTSTVDDGFNDLYELTEFCLDYVVKCLTKAVNNNRFECFCQLQFDSKLLAVKHLKNDHFNQQPHSSTVEQVKTTNNVSLDSIENAQLFVQTEPSQPQYLQQSTNIQSKNKPLPVIATETIEQNDEIVGNKLVKTSSTKTPVKNHDIREYTTPSPKKRARLTDAGVSLSTNQLIPCIEILDDDDDHAGSSTNAAGSKTSFIAIAKPSESAATVVTPPLTDERLQQILREHSPIQSTVVVPEQPNSTPIFVINEQTFVDDSIDDDTPPDLTQHELVVLADISSQFSCPFCDSSYVSTALLNDHLATQHGPRRNDQQSSSEFACNRCTKRYMHKSHLQRHLRIHHQIMGKYRCKICNRLYHTNIGLRQHRLRSHKLLQTNNNQVVPIDAAHNVQVQVDPLVHHETQQQGQFRPLRAIPALCESELQLPPHRMEEQPQQVHASPDYQHYQFSEFIPRFSDSFHPTVPQLQHQPQDIIMEQQQRLDQQLRVAEQQRHRRVEQLQQQVCIADQSPITSQQKQRIQPQASVHQQQQVELEQQPMPRVNPQKLNHFQQQQQPPRLGAQQPISHHISNLGQRVIESQSTIGQSQLRMEQIIPLHQPPVQQSHRQQLQKELHPQVARQLPRIDHQPSVSGQPPKQLPYTQQVADLPVIELPQPTGPSILNPSVEQRHNRNPYQSGQQDLLYQQNQLLQQSHIHSQQRLPIPHQQNYQRPQLLRQQATREQLPAAQLNYDNNALLMQTRMTPPYRELQYGEQLRSQVQQRPPNQRSPIKQIRQLPQSTQNVLPATTSATVTATSTYAVQPANTQQRTLMDILKAASNDMATVSTTSVPSTAITSSSSTSSIFKEQQFCSYCAQHFSSSKYCRYHIHNHHGIAYELCCHLCRQPYVDRANFQKHMLNKHQIDVTNHR